VKRVSDIRQVGLSPIDPRLFIDDQIEYREYFCPGCGLLLQGDFSRPGDPDFRDICLAAAVPAGGADQTDG